MRAHHAVVPLLGRECRPALWHQPAIGAEGQVLHAVQVLHFCRVGRRALVRVVRVVQEESDHGRAPDLRHSWALSAGSRFGRKNQKTPTHLILGRPGGRHTWTWGFTRRTRSATRSTWRKEESPPAETPVTTSSVAFASPRRSAHSTVASRFLIPRNHSFSFVPGTLQGLARKPANEAPSPYGRYTALQSMSNVSPSAFMQPISHCLKWNPAGSREKGMVGGQAVLVPKAPLLLARHSASL